MYKQNPTIIHMGLDSFTTLHQLLHNLKVHWGVTHTMDLTPMYLEVVQ
jgi:hypothetical protein